MISIGVACGMDAKSEIRGFLASRRARITPDQVGLPVRGDKRRDCAAGRSRCSPASARTVSVDSSFDAPGLQNG